MAKSTIQLTDDDTINLMAILEMMRPTLDAEHGPGFFATTPFQAIRSKFPRNDDFFAPRPTEIHLSDIELGALKEVLDFNRLMSGNTSNDLREGAARIRDACLHACRTPQPQQGRAAGRGYGLLWSASNCKPPVWPGLMLSVPGERAGRRRQSRFSSARRACSQPSCHSVASFVLLRWRHSSLRKPSRNAR
jgi:hypothetical protein